MRSKEEAIACTNEMMEVLGCKTIADLLKIDDDKLVEAASIHSLGTAPERDGYFSLLTGELEGAILPHKEGWENLFFTFHFSFFCFLRIIESPLYFKRALV